MRRKWIGAFGIAFFNDLLDLTGVFSIPILGDILDLATSTILWKLLGTRYTAPTFLELMPGIDFIPVHTVSVAAAYYREEINQKSLN